MKISLLIPAYNEEKGIGACLHSVIEHSRGRFFEIIVIDNASTDRTVQIARTHYGIRVIHEPRKGLGFARERGRVEARGDLLAYIDADCRLPMTWIDKVDSCFAAQPNVVSLSGPAIYFDATWDQKLILSALWRMSAPLMYRLVGYMVYGAHFVVRKAALEAIGGFNCQIQFYGEDTDLARRLSSTGKVLFRMDFPILTSARRFTSEGIVRSNAMYAVNYLWPVLCKRPFSSTHKDVR